MCEQWDRVSYDGWTMVGVPRMSFPWAITVRSPSRISPTLGQ